MVTDERAGGRRPLRPVNGHPKHLIRANTDEQVGERTHDDLMGRSCDRVSDHTG
ncbi:hypothetical protein [Protofrankia symbiont of Coriaria ruscifolia]|uniref:hypothetical protein n=1 Tax=Protofrankia symbiont of Coriaria ruscifolia TaxID=1306542 RepID=UPI001A953E8A|nr:hypothetical protein [Protofrankia symbiont of Coriaria ruscifolia]